MRPVSLVVRVAYAIASYRFCRPVLFAGRQKAFVRPLPVRDGETPGRVHLATLRATGVTHR